MRISWEQHHMLLAKVTSLRSPDPNTKVGACIVSVDNRVISLGYNGAPRGIYQAKVPWEVRTGKVTENKYGFAVHAELNAILNAKEDLSGAILYTTLLPCHECAKAIIQSGIYRTIYLYDKYPHLETFKQSKYLFELAPGTTLEEFKYIDKLEVLLETLDSLIDSKEFT